MSELFPLRLATASQQVPLGYYVSSTDGDTERTAISVTAALTNVWKTGGTTLAAKNSGNATHISNGIFYTVLDATDTNTLGPLALFTHISTALPVKMLCLVMPKFAYDTEISGLRFCWALTSISGTAITVPATPAFDIDEFIGRHLVLTAGPCRGQRRRITTNTASSGTHILTIASAFNGTPTSSTEAKIV